MVLGRLGHVRGMFRGSMFEGGCWRLDVRDSDSPTVSSVAKAKYNADTYCEALS